MIVTGVSSHARLHQSLRLVSREKQTPIQTPHFRLPASFNWGGTAVFLPSYSHTRLQRIEQKCWSKMWRCVSRGLRASSSSFSRKSSPNDHLRSHISRFFSVDSVWIFILCLYYWIRAVLIMFSIGSLIMLIVASCFKLISYGCGIGVKLLRTWWLFIGFIKY